ncbi:MAG TPA: hypothetical protein DET40_21690 [Lentisphaeria bacterium]|nr:MAG: hypothetical protein A2X45_10970 [Lentisphaerae bacterium GWF2_50_93]HCE46166.1 hypothetical protein [Lentisphaeria bacterium]
MIIPERPMPGAPIPRGWFADFYDYVMSQRLRGDGRTFFTKDTDQGRVGSTKPEGFTPGAGGEASAPCCVPAKIVSKDGAFYVVDLYANGYDKAYTTYHVTAQIQLLNFAETLPAGTPIVVLSSFIASTGEST